MTLEAETPRRGRKPDPARDAEILEIALDVLAETGYEGMTIDLVAAKAKAGKGTMYRRWSSKEKLVLEAVDHLRRKQVDLSSLPETGTLRGDLLALAQADSLTSVHKRMKLLAALSLLSNQGAALATASNDALVKPWVEVNRIFLKRALARKEISKSVDLASASQVIPALAVYRSLILQKPFDRKFLVSIVDGVLLPMLGIKKSLKE